MKSEEKESRLAKERRMERRGAVRMLRTLAKGIQALGLESVTSKHVADLLRGAAEDIKAGQHRADLAIAETFAWRDLP